MYLSKLMINEILNNANLDENNIKSALQELGYDFKEMVKSCKQEDSLEICHVGSSHQLDDTHEYLSLVDIGEDLPAVAISQWESKSGDFIIFAKNYKKIFKKGKIEPRRHNELKTDGYLCTLDDLGYNFKILDYNKTNNLLPILSKEDFSKKYGMETILDIIGVKDIIFHINTNNSFYEIINDLAFYFRKKPVRSELDELDNIKMDITINGNIESNDLAVVGYQFIPVRKIFEITETKWELYTYDFLLLDKLNIVNQDNIFINLTNILEYESNARVIFFDYQKINGIINIKHMQDLLVISDNNNVIYNSEGYVNIDYIPNKSTKNIIAIYLLENSQRSNIDYIKNRVGYWLNRYLISNQYSQIRYFDNYAISFKKFHFDMSNINNNMDDKKRIRQITKLLRFFDIDVKEFEEHTGEFTIANTNGKIDSIDKIYSLIEQKLKFNKI